MKYIVSTLTLLFVWACSKSETVEEQKPTAVLVQKITIVGQNISDGTTQQLSATISPTDASNKSITWSTSDASIATIDQKGLLSAVSNGTVNVKATANDASKTIGQKSFLVSGVVIAVQSVNIQGGRDITDTKSLQLEAQVLPSNATNKAVEWAVSDANIAEISQTGLLTPKTNGAVVVTLTSKASASIHSQITINISGFNGQGTNLNTAQQIMAAIGNAQPGDVITIDAGTYAFGSSIGLSKSGTNSAPITLQANPNTTDRVVFDFSSMSTSSSNRGVRLSGSYWHVKQIDFVGAGDNGMYLSGNYNIVENCVFKENKDTGLQLGGGATKNKIINCDSFDNVDPTHENADGYAAKMDVGTENEFIGCRAWQNSDDGFDGYLRGADNVTTYYSDCWAFSNGYFANGSKTTGDGNGFKTGGSDNKLLKHHTVFNNCIAANNVADGFDHNSNRGDIVINNGSSYKNGRNVSFSNTNIANNLTIKNTLSFDGVNSDSVKATNLDVTNNSWQDGLAASADDFVSINLDLLKSPRNADGSLPVIDFLKLKTSSDLIDKGVDVGLPYLGNAPDLGAFELK